MACGPTLGPCTTPTAPPSVSAGLNAPYQGWPTYCSPAPGLVGATDFSKCHVSGPYCPTQKSSQVLCPLQAQRACAALLQGRGQQSSVLFRTLLHCTALLHHVLCCSALYCSVDHGTAEQGLECRVGPKCWPKRSKKPLGLSCCCPMRSLRTETCMRQNKVAQCIVEDSVADALWDDFVDYAAGFANSNDMTFLDHEFFKHGSCEWGFGVLPGLWGAARTVWGRLSARLQGSCPFPLPSCLHSGRQKKKKNAREGS